MFASRVGGAFRQGLRKTSAVAVPQNHTITRGMAAGGKYVLETFFYFPFDNFECALISFLISLSLFFLTFSH
jgi:hypothetical protein